MCAKHLRCYEAKWPNLKLKTQPKQRLGSLPLAFELTVPMIPLGPRVYGSTT